MSRALLNAVVRLSPAGAKKASETDEGSAKARRPQMELSPDALWNVFMRAGEVKLVGKCIDLESAYKQCPVQPAHSRYGIFAIKNPETNQAESCLARGLPFEAAASVHGSRRAAMALNFLLHENVGVPCSHYFDDHSDRPISRWQNR